MAMVGNSVYRAALDEQAVAQAASILGRDAREIREEARQLAESKAITIGVAAQEILERELQRTAVATEAALQELEQLLAADLADADPAAPSDRPNRHERRRQAAIERKRRKRR